MLIWAIALSPIWGAFLRHAWDLGVRSRLTPPSEIKALVDELIAKHGPRADEAAFIEEDRAWRYSKTFQQGKWRRARRELWRRRQTGEWRGPGS